MKAVKFSSLVFMSILLFTCAVTNDIVSEYDTSVDFSEYTTFVLCIDDLFVENWQFPNYDNNTIRQTIAEDLEAKMELHGFKTNVMNPDLQVGFQLVVKQENVTFTNCEIQEDYGYWENCTLETTVYTDETLIVYASDISKNQIVWQASIACDMNQSKTKLKSYVDKIMTLIFEEFPKASENL